MLSFLHPLHRGGQNRWMRCAGLTSALEISRPNGLRVVVDAGDVYRFNHHHQFLQFCRTGRATLQADAFPGQT